MSKVYSFWLGARIPWQQQRPGSVDSGAVWWSVSCVTPSRAPDPVPVKKALATEHDYESATLRAAPSTWLAARQCNRCDGTDSLSRLNLSTRYGGRHDECLHALRDRILRDTRPRTRRPTGTARRAQPTATCGGGARRLAAAHRRGGRVWQDPGAR